MSSTSIYPYVYWCTHKTTGEFYIGYREANKLPAQQDLPKYKTSSKKVHPIFDQFDWFIVAEFFDKNSAYDFEQQLIHENWSNPLLLNESCHYDKARFKLDKHTAETKLKISKTRTGQTATIESRAINSKSKIGIPHSEKWNLNVSASKKGKARLDILNVPRSVHTKSKIAAALTGITHKKDKCIYCGKISTVQNIVRWHNNNCKFK